MKYNSGFTLIELVIVIIILGVLSITAAPKFLAISSDARTANVLALKGSLRSAANLIYTKARIQGIEGKRKHWVDFNGDGNENLVLHAGYPAVINSCSSFISGLDSWMNLTIATSCDSDPDPDWYGYVDWNTFHFMPTGYTSIDRECYVSYEEATSDGSQDGFSRGQPLDYITVTAVTDGC